MKKSGNLWEVGHDDVERANQVRDKIITLGWDKPYLLLDDPISNPQLSVKCWGENRCILI
jgi:hypothetical protein